MIAVYSAPGIEDERKNGSAKTTTSNAATGTETSAALSSPPSSAVKLLASSCVQASPDYQPGDMKEAEAPGSAETVRDGSEVKSQSVDANGKSLQSLSFSAVSLFPFSTTSEAGSASQAPSSDNTDRRPRSSSGTFKCVNFTEEVSVNVSAETSGDSAALVVAADAETARIHRNTLRRSMSEGSGYLPYFGDSNGMLTIYHMLLCCLLMRIF
jgi:hypothetical protein